MEKIQKEGGIRIESTIRGSKVEMVDRWDEAREQELDKWFSDPEKPQEDSAGTICFDDKNKTYWRRKMNKWDLWDRVYALLRWLEAF